uniref:Uncharacterized protein n=1 Tax=Euplotes harpa TaxID=151035 RepID=A0A7S3J9G8_9SPIT|mmetsp:Transcript_275/g.274  ORF Transcript_275/g.274 Transcript_275/m.274 type:complete len:157 (+) Transcript_275:164-634(+)
MSVPITDQFAGKVSHQDVEDPVKMASRINSEEKYRKEKFPMRHVFGSNRANRRVDLPVENREFHNLSHKGLSNSKADNRFKPSIKTYDENNRMDWMGSSIDISQPEIKRFLFNDSNKKQNINRSQIHSKLDDIFNAKPANEPEANSYQYLETIHQK